jgi:tRNA threonylcarbamoyladenosine biosynthesis protein TsaB
MLHLCYASLEAGKKPFFEASIVTLANQHSEQLMPRILQLCDTNKITLKDLDLLACSSGPGSFTGLRISMSTLKGISVATGIPLVSIPTLEAYYHCVDQLSSAVLSVIDAKKQRFYAALFVDGRRVTPDLDAELPQLEALLSRYDEVLLTGPDASLLAHRLSPSLHVRVDAPGSLNLGPILCRLAQEQYLSQGADDIGKGPVYVRKSDAEIALQQTIHAMEEHT